MGSIKVLNKISGPPAGNTSSHQVEKLHFGLSTEQLLPRPLSRGGGGGGVLAAVSDRHASGTLSASRLGAARLGWLAADRSFTDSLSANESLIAEQKASEVLTS